MAQGLHAHQDAQFRPDAVIHFGEETSLFLLGLRRVC